MLQQESKPIKLAVNIGFLNNTEKEPVNFSTNTLRMSNVAANEACMFEMPDQSMLPLLNEGATVGIKLTDEVAFGEVHLVKVNGAFMLRLIRRADNGYELVPLASPSDSRVVPKEKLEIVGMMFWFQWAA